MFTLENSEPKFHQYFVSPPPHNVQHNVIGPIPGPLKDVLNWPNKPINRIHSLLEKGTHFSHLPLDLYHRDIVILILFEMFKTIVYLYDMQNVIKFMLLDSSRIKFEGMVQIIKPSCDGLISDTLNQCLGRKIRNGRRGEKEMEIQDNCPF